MYYLDGVTIPHSQLSPTTHTHTHRLHWNYNECYNHHLVTSSSSTIIGIQERCWHLSGLTHAGMLANNKHAHAHTHTEVDFKWQRQRWERSLGNIFLISTGPYLAVEIEEVKGVHTHLDFDLRGIHVLQGGIKTHGRLNYFSLDKNMQIDASYSQIATSNLGTCYKERFDFSPVHLES